MRIVREAACPVVALLHTHDPAYVREAARRGVFAYIVDGSAEELQSAIEITLQRFAEYQGLRGALGRRVLIEQAKGILMERYAIDADRAFDLLREQSQRRGRKLVDIAAAMVTRHPLLSGNSERLMPPGDGGLAASSEVAQADQPKLVTGDGLTDA